MPLSPQKLRLEKLRGKTTPLSSGSGNGLKVFHPRIEQWCHSIVSSYGGGMVQGDQLGLDLECGPETRLYLTSPGFTQVYRGRSSFHLRGRLERDAVVIYHGLPLVPHAASSYLQRNHWNLSPKATLISIEWLLSGRIARGETFQFEELANELTVSHDHDLILSDRFRMEPAQRRHRSGSLFGQYEALLTITLIGPEGDPAAQALSERWMKAIGPRRPSAPPERIVSVSPLPRGGHQLRAAARERMQLLEVEHSLFQHLRDCGLLDFDPLRS